MNFRPRLSYFLLATAASALFLSPTTAQTLYEATPNNTELTFWGGEQSGNFPLFEWTSGVNFDPGNLLNEDGATDDRVIFGRYQPLTSQFASQNFRVVSPVEQIAHLQVGSGNQTLSPIFTGAKQNAQIQVQVQSDLTINGNASGEAILFGVGNGQGGVNVNNNNGNLNVRGDLNFAASNQDGSSWPISNTTTGTIVVPHFVTLNANDATLNLGGDINGADAISLRLDTGTFIMDTTGDGVTDDGPQTFNVNQFNVAGNANPADDRNSEYTFGPGKTVNAWISEIGKRTNANAGNVDAVLNIDGATVTTRTMNVGMIAGGAAVVVPTDSATGTVNISNGGTLTVGRVNADGITYGGNLVIGNSNADQLAGGIGTVNVNDGTVNILSQLYIAGDSIQGADDDARGTLNVNSGGVINVGQASQNQKNIEVGRDGAGSLNVNGGTINIGWGNIVIGQTVDANSLISNNARGTVVFDGGAQINVGDNAANPATGEQLFNSNFNFNRSGGDVTHTGANTTVTIEQDLNFQDALDAADAQSSLNPNSSYTIDNGSLTIGLNLNGRINLDGTNTLKIVGDQASVAIGNNANINQSSFTLEFDFMGGNSVSTIEVGNNVNLSGDEGSATLTLANTEGLSTYSGDIVLLDVANVTNGAFANAAQDDVFGSYRLVFDYDASTGSAGGGQSIALVSESGQTVGLQCDLDADGDCDQSDIDVLYGSNPSVDDINDWLTQASSASNPFNTDGETFVLGDVNLDGDVNSLDLGLLLNNFNDDSGATWDGGDLNADNAVNSADLGLVLNNFNFTSASANAVPEPSPSALLMIGALSLLAIRRRR